MLIAEAPAGKASETYFTIGLGAHNQNLVKSCVAVLQKHYDVKSQSFNPGLQYPHLHGPVHTPDNNRWDTPPV